MEKWKPIVGYEGLYEISSEGRMKILPKTIMNNGTPFLQKEIITSAHSEHKNKYLVYGMTLNGKRKTYRVSRLVAIAFLPNPENKREVNHKDGNKQNNNVENLEWATPKENTIHAFSTGLVKVKKGEEKPCAKLKNEDVLEIRKLCQLKRYNQTEIGKMFGVGKSTVGYISNNKTWMHI